MQFNSQSAHYDSNTPFCYYVVFSLHSNLPVEITFIIQETEPSNTASYYTVKA